MGDPGIEKGPSVVNVGHHQQMALLRDLVEVNGCGKAAKILGASCRSLARAAGGGRFA